MFNFAVQNNPFPEGLSQPSFLHVGFLFKKPINPNIKKLNELKLASEKFTLIDNIFYLFAPDGVGRSRLAANSEKLLGVDMTDRNWNTVMKIKIMLERK